MAKKKVDLLKQELEMYLSAPSVIMKTMGWSKEEYDAKILELEDKIEQSRRGRSSKRKGANYERQIAKVFKDKLGVELKRTPLSGGFAKGSKRGNDFRGDIITVDDNVDFNLHIECKDQQTWSLPSWLRQAEEDCPDGRVPIVIFHRRQQNKDGKRIQEVGDFVTLSLEDFLDIVDVSKIIKEK